MAGKIKKIKWKKKNLSDWEKQRAYMEGIGLEDVVRFGASDISVITGNNQWKCPQRLFYSSVGFYSHFQMTERTVAGHLIEECIANRFESFNADDEQKFWQDALDGIKHRRVKKADFFLLNSDYPNMFVSVDYIPKGEVASPFTGEIYHPMTPIEMKHTTESYYKLWPKYKDTHGRITKGYMDQIQAQMMISGTDSCVFLVLVDGVKFVAVEIDRDEKICGDIAAKVLIFAEKVKIGKLIVKMMSELPEDDIIERGELQMQLDAIAPAPIGIEDNTNLLKEIYRTNNGQQMVGTKQDETDMQRYLDLNEIKKNSEYEQLTLRNNLVFKAGEFEYLVAGSMKLTNRKANGDKKGHFSIKMLQTK